ncbi:unnamed protein product [Camellia sinensis]|uniref:bidirectional sugar transporter SWEET6a-like n=1 Tax=Camellia sinensis TaxID=4442 RepID=UPI0010355318|nr:bidirectional sugar transporter SWEET6a-like [Camellia sinensis]
MATAALARTIVGVIGNVISFCLFISPMPTFWRIFKNKSVEEFKPDPYLATVVNCMFWVFYGLPIIHPDSTLVITINSVGLALELFYLTIFLIYTTNHKRLKIVLYLVLEVVVLVAVGVPTILKVHTHEKRSMVVGIFCVIFGGLMYAAPLTIMRKVIKTKSVEFMPFWLSFAAFSNGVIWLIYALIKFDPYIFTGNGLGTLCGAAQLILYAYYYKSTPKGNEKNPPQVQMAALP